MKQQKKNWPAESNMTALKTLSHTLLHLDIQPTKMSPLVVKHPFTDSGLAGIYAEDGSLSVGNLLDSPDALRTWRENFSRRINEAETAMNLFCMITKPYQFGYLRLAAAHLSEQDIQLPKAAPVSTDALRIENELALCFNRADINPEYMKTLIMAAAAERYAGLNDPTPTHKLELLRQKLELEPESEETLWEVFESAVAQVRIGKGGEISLHQKDQKECAL